ncbi:hypothetical protein, partial [Inquilinus sp. OTU3971]|uniref:hypothetical protein n=1 Tax=Inquilinus sp. OTU3971 TaxID=3043855 RepID=UPI00313E3692
MLTGGNFLQNYRNSLVVTVASVGLTVSAFATYALVEYRVRAAPLLAALTLGAVPLVLLFVLFSRQFIRGVSQGFSRWDRRPAGGPLHQGTRRGGAGGPRRGWVKARRR